MSPISPQESAQLFAQVVCSPTEACQVGYCLKFTMDMANKMVGCDSKFTVLTCLHCESRGNSSRTKLLKCVLIPPLLTSIIGMLGKKWTYLPKHAIIC